MADVTLEVDGQKISAHMFYPDFGESKSPTILFIHGWESGQDRYYKEAGELTKLGYVCMTFDLRGHGESEGDYKSQTRRDFLNDVLAAYDHLAGDNLVDPDNITVIGSSFGSYLGVLLSAQRKVRNLILRVPANYPDDYSDEAVYKYSGTSELLAWRQHPKKYSEIKSLSCLHGFDGNVLIVESGEDELVPHQTIENYLNAVNDKARLTHIVMKNAPHSITDFPEFKKEFNKIVIDWLKSRT